MTLQTIRPIDVLQTAFITRQTRTGRAWGLSPSMAAACGLGRQFVREGRVLAEQWSLAQQAVLLDLDQRVAVVEAFSVTAQQVQAAMDKSVASAVATERLARQDAVRILQLDLADERTGRLTGQQIIATDVTALRATVTDLQAQVTALANRALSVQRVGVTTGLLLAANATTDLPVTWRTEWPDTDYVVAAGMCPTNAVTVLETKSKTKAGCVVTIRANGLALALGATVDVIGVRYG